MIFERNTFHDQSSDENSSILSLVRCRSIEKLPMKTMMKNISSFRLPSVPKGAGVFIQQFVKNVFSMTNTHIGKTTIKSKIKRVGPLLKTKILSDESQLYVNMKSKERRQRSTLTSNNNNSQECGACQRYRTICQNRSEKLLTDAQRFEIASAIELIFKTMLSVYS